MCYFPISRGIEFERHAGSCLSCSNSDEGSCLRITEYCLPESHYPLKGIRKLLGTKANTQSFGRTQWWTPRRPQHEDIPLLTYNISTNIPTNVSKWLHRTNYKFHHPHPAFSILSFPVSCSYHRLSSFTLWSSTSVPYALSRQAVITLLITMGRPVSPRFRSDHAAAEGICCVGRCLMGWGALCHWSPQCLSLTSPFHRSSQ